MSGINNVEPSRVFYYFNQITDIPRPSYSEKEMCNYLVSFAREHGLEYYSDDFNNVIIKKPATYGYENKDAIILQAHIDMVCVCERGMNVDFQKDPVCAYVEGDYVKAKGTSLGADDGIGMAMILALLDSRTIQHPALEAVFTAAEEVGLDGAKGLDKSLLTGKKLINIDSEEDYNLVIGCAGGCRTDISFDYEPKKKCGKLFEIRLEGLSGGHSGVEIHKGSANAICLLGRLLSELSSDTDIRLVSIEGGDKDNAICTCAKAVILADEEYMKDILVKTNQIASVYEKLYSQTDPNIKVIVSEGAVGKSDVLKKKDFRKVINLICNTPDGIIRKSTNNPSLVEVSANHGIIKVADGHANVCISLRSSIDSELDWLKRSLNDISDLCEASIIYRGEYPAWESNGLSDFVLFAAGKYMQLFGKEINVCSIHAGLECALFCSQIQDLEAISIGPTMYGVHTTEEKLSVSSVQRVWKYLQEIIKG